MKAIDSGLEFIAVRSDELSESKYAWMRPQLHGLTFWESGYMQPLLQMRSPEDLIAIIYNKATEQVVSWMIVACAFRVEPIEPSWNGGRLESIRDEFYEDMAHKDCEVCLNIFTRASERGKGIAKHLLTFVESMFELDKVLVCPHDTKSKMLYEPLIEKGAREAFSL